MMSGDDNNLLLSLPPALAMRSSGYYDEANDPELLPLTTQNYMERYRDLEKILSEEKKTNEQLKKFYNALKTDHTRLKNENLEVRAQITNLIEENKIMQEKYKSMLDKMQQESRRKQLFIEDLKNRELDDVKLERIKEELTQQIEAPYKDIVRQLEQALQTQQAEINKLRNENAMSHSANEREKAEHHNFVEQLRVKQELELNVIRRERDSLRAKLQESNQSDINKIKDALRENNQLKIRVKALIEENEELREKVERAESHNNLLVRNHSKSLSDYTTRISVLESERESLKQQADNAQKETFNLNSELSDNLRKLNELERENTTLKLKMDEVQHNSKKDVANLKLEMTKERGIHNRELETLKNEIEDLKQKVEMANGNVEMQKKMLEEKERELAKIMNNINEENWSKITELTNEKIEMESKYQLMTKDFEFKLSALQLEKDKSDDKLRAFEKQREEIIKENTRLRSVINETESLRNELEREQEKSRELSRKVQKLETEIGSNMSLEHELSEINMRLKNELAFSNQETTRFKDQLNRIREEYDNKLVEVKNQQTSEKNELKFKNEDLQAKLNRANGKLNDIKKYHEKKKKQYQAYSKALKHKSEALNDRIRELQLKEQSVGQMVPAHAYNKLKAHLNLLVKKHQAFKDMLMSGGNFNGQTPINIPPFNSTSMGIGSMPALNRNDLDREAPVFELMSGNLPSMMTNTNPKVENRDFEMNKKFDEIVNKFDVLTSTQNEHIRNNMSTTTAVSDRSPPPRASTRLNQSRTRDEQPANSSQHSPQRQIELKKVPISSSSSSSSSPIALTKNQQQPSTTQSAANNNTNNTSQKPNRFFLKDDDEDDDDEVSEKLVKKSTPKQDRKRDSSYEDDFENSIKSDF